MLVQAARAQGPDLPRLKRIGADAVLARELRRDDELLDALLPC
jgi:hypothetical protein